MTWVAEKIITKTNTYIDNTPKNERTDKGQFITPFEIANVMSDMLTIEKQSISILDPGAGSGVLAALLIDKILNEGYVKEIQVTLYENDLLILNLLQSNMVEVYKTCLKHNVKLIFNINSSNFITKNKNIWMTEEYTGSYDYVICNPPYMKLNKSSLEAQTMNSIVYGQPNLYFLFMAMAVKQLKKDAQAVFIVPRSFFNGSYFRKFREWLLMNSSIERIHHFESRERVFSGEILQETVILKIIKSDISEINITTSYDSHDMQSCKSILVTKDLIISKKFNTIRLPLNRKDSWTVFTVDSFKNTFFELGIKFSTGPIVDFRRKEFISKEKTKNTVPLIWSCNFTKHKIFWPSENIKFHQHILKNKKVLPYLLPKDDYILVKRFTTKEARRPLKINILLAENISYERFGIENHINYLKSTKFINRHILCGIAVLLKSQLYNDYFRIINGTTQVNVSDLNALPCPELTILEMLGKEYLSVFIKDDDIQENKILEILKLRQSL
ncbi:MAG: Eco57I restriction-modification methylase domain-containing protein [Sporomusaceae bacterium]|nr:Eco57I restriction-modification methylase domain-containing protein [Sporomusaceae bacterium]